MDTSHKGLIYDGGGGYSFVIGLLKTPTQGRHALQRQLIQGRLA